jgi:hypothetical protein
MPNELIIGVPSDVTNENVLQLFLNQLVIKLSDLLRQPTITTVNQLSQQVLVLQQQMLTESDLQTNITLTSVDNSTITISSSYDDEEIEELRDRLSDTTEQLNLVIEVLKNSGIAE